MRKNKNNLSFGIIIFVICFSLIIAYPKILWLLLGLLCIFLFIILLTTSGKKTKRGTVKDNSDIIKGYRFCATMQLRTPLDILNMHYKFNKGPEKDLPKCHQADGIWTIELSSWKELGISGLKELPKGTMASDIGQIPEDGGEYLKFLKLFRKIVESDLDDSIKCDKIKQLVNVNEKYSEFYSKHDNLKPENIHKYLYELKIYELKKTLDDESLSYALGISEIVPQVKKLDTLASRYNTAHKGAGGLGLLSGMTSQYYNEVSGYIHKIYLNRFSEIVDTIIINSIKAANQRKTSKGKISVYNKAKEQINSNSSAFEYDLPNLKETVEALHNKLNEEIEKVKE